MTTVVAVGDVQFGAEELCLIGGPCVIESRSHALETATAIKEICDRLGVPFVYKSSFDKANRTSVESYRGTSLDAGLEVLAEVRSALRVPVLTDVHESWQVKPVAEVVDVLQIPAFLCRQTDLLLAAAESGCAVNVKKGQFLSPPEMQHVVAKLESGGTDRILVTERGSSFGYNTLVVDFRSLPQLKTSGYPVVFDATHSVQEPGGLGGRSGGQRRWVPYLARAAVAVGVDALFMEVHGDPDNAPSDGPNMVPLGRLEVLLADLVSVRRASSPVPEI